MRICHCNGLLTRFLSPLKSGLSQQCDLGNQRALMLLCKQFSILDGHGNFIGAQTSEAAADSVTFLFSVSFLEFRFPWVPRGLNLTAFSILLDSFAVVARFGRSRWRLMLVVGW